MPTTKIKKLPFKEFQAIYNRVPRFCVDLVIQGKRGVVLSKRDIPPAKGLWHLPGGTLLFREKISNAITRVALEETGLKVKIVRLIGIIEYSKASGLGHSIGAAYLLRVIGGKLHGSKQASEINYFNVAPDRTIHEQVDFLTQHGLIK